MTFIGSKSMGLNSIPRITLKQSKETHSLLLAKLLNKSFETRVFPNLDGLGKVVLIFKSETRLFYNNDRKFSCFQILVKLLKKWCIKDSIVSLNNAMITDPSNLPLDLADQLTVL